MFCFLNTTKILNVLFYNLVHWQSRTSGKKAIIDKTIRNAVEHIKLCVVAVSYKSELNKIG